MEMPDCHNAVVIGFSIRLFRPNSLNGRIENPSDDYMITLEEFKKEILGKEADSMTEAEINSQYRIYTAFADFAYKSWIQSRQLDITKNKK